MTRPRLILPFANPPQERPILPCSRIGRHRLRQRFGVDPQRLNDRCKDRHLRRPAGAERQPPIDDQRVAGDEARSVAGKIERGSAMSRARPRAMGCEFFAASAMASIRPSATWLGIPKALAKMLVAIRPAADAVDADVRGAKLRRGHARHVRRSPPWRSNRGSVPYPAAAPRRTRSRRWSRRPARASPARRI